MAIKYRENGNQLVVDDNTIVFDHQIRYIEEVSNTLIILLEIPYEKTYLNNVFGISDKGEIKWRIDRVGDFIPIKNQLPFENLMVRANDVFVSDFYGRRFSLDPISGKIISYDVVR